ncbi:hypothetical protein ASZ78_011569 [Callipepla squamata]|uniref:EF-hand domain-containing protein n=1 Tax=Callipepla squamata TaxID=9009 RepID=A0A226MEL0_CALSU|nr:hypothetical protein ASZ78_011569 [Callipepla squamata]
MSKKRLQQLVESLSRSAKHFNKGEVECLVGLFDTLLGASCSRFAAVGFDRGAFCDILHRVFGMTELLDRVFRAFDRDNDNCISVVEWVEGLSVFLRGTLEERIKCKDCDHDGKLSFADFEEAVKKENLLLEAFGPCLPDIKSTIAFERRTFQESRKL